MDGGVQSSSPIGADQHIRLACQACQRKKIKCDRHFPCGQCTRSNLHCIASTRKPRARHVGKRALDSELRTRISKLESLVENLSGEVGAQNDSSENEIDGRADPDETQSPAVGKYIASSFWSSLAGEVKALKDALEDDHGDEDEATSPSSHTPSAPAEYDLIVCPPGSIFVMPGALPEPSPQISARLCQVFCDNVDRMFKLYHTPTLQAFMMEGKSYLGHEPSAPCNRALRASIWLAATNTLSETECQMMFNQTRQMQIQQFRKIVDVAFAQADLMTTCEIATLQAFATYLIAARLTDTSRRTWSMVALLVRLARGIDLHHETVVLSPYDAEIRRRLWHNIRFLDVYSSWDRSSDILIGMGSYDTPRPRHCNDTEFNESSTQIPEHETGLTDMSFAMLAYDATYSTHQLLAPEGKPNGGDAWEDRLELAHRFEERVQDKFMKYLDLSDPFHKLLSYIATSMMASCRLRAVRPLRKHPASRPPRVDSPEVLRLAMESLKATEAIHSDPDSAPYRWMVWVPWHALAVALAGLCAIRDTPLANEAWPHVEKVFVRQSMHVADARTGMLWRPIEKLYKTASAFREHREASPHDASPLQPQQQPGANAQVKMETQPLPSIELDASLAPPLMESQAMTGILPAANTMNPQMSLDFGNGMLGDFDLTNNNMNWMDFQNIFQDMSTPAPDLNFSQLPWPDNVPQVDNWGNPLAQNF